VQQVERTEEFGGLAITPDPTQRPVPQQRVAGGVRHRQVDAEPLVPVQRPLLAQRGEDG